MVGGLWPRVPTDLQSQSRGGNCAGRDDHQHEDKSHNCTIRLKFSIGVSRGTRGSGIAMIVSAPCCSRRSIDLGAAGERDELPHGRGTNECINELRKGRSCAENGCHKVQIEQPDEPPIQPAYDDEKKGNKI